MKTTTLCALALMTLGLGAAHAAQNYEVLAGKWNGTITTNLKDATGGGSPTVGETGTPVVIQFTKSGNMLEGSSLVGKNMENWKIAGEKYFWTDMDMSVTTTAISFKDLPEWVKKQANVTETDTFFAYKYASCTMNKTKKACEPGKDLPDGLDKNGIWLFKVKGDAMQNNVYYTYSNGGKRILEQSLTLSKK